MGAGRTPCIFDIVKLNTQMGKHYGRGRQMLEITIPSKASYELHYLLLDMNGAIALDGEG